MEKFPLKSGMKQGYPFHEEEEEEREEEEEEN